MLNAEATTEKVYEREPIARGLVKTAKATKRLAVFGRSIERLPQGKQRPRRLPDAILPKCAGEQPTLRGHRGLTRGDCACFGRLGRLAPVPLGEKATAERILGR